MEKFSFSVLIILFFHVSYIYGQNTSPFLPIKIIETEQQKIDIIMQLGKIQSDDQSIRNKAIGIEKKIGRDSKEYKIVINEWKIVDSLNLNKLEHLIDTFGFDTIIKYGEDAVFFVVQHSKLIIQEKHLPKMREAAKRGNLQYSRLAMLEDRVLLASGKKQIYGTQMIKDPETGIYFVRPLEEPETVNLRRMSVGLLSMHQYLTYFNTKWNLEEYKKKISYIEKLEKALNDKKQ